MFTFNKTMSANALGEIEQLQCAFFEGEANAHAFSIAPMAGVSFTGYSVLGRLVRADGRYVEISGSLQDGSAYVVLGAACYAVPGNWRLYVYVQSEAETVCVYACAGQVLCTHGENGSAGEQGPIIEANGLNEWMQQVNERLWALEGGTIV